jgi:hypothetical protein
VNALHCSGVARIKSFPVGRAGENRWRIEANEDKSPNLHFCFWWQSRRQNVGKSNHDA